MIKRDELIHPKSCLSQARDDEPVFVLKSTDKHAPMLVELWADIREMEGSTRHEKIEEARALAKLMRKWQEANPQLLTSTSWKMFLNPSGI